MSSLDQAKLLLKDKYQLVHVPNRHKVLRWASEVRAAMRDGLHSEDAGKKAARVVFPYEYRGQSTLTGVPVERLVREIENANAADART